MSETHPIFNRSAIHRHAMKVSDETRAGKFTRVSEKFIDDVIADVDCELRKQRAVEFVTIGNSPVVPSEENYLTVAGRENLVAAFEVTIGKIIQRKVHATRVGKTL